MLPKGNKMWTHAILSADEATRTPWTQCSSVHWTGVDITGAHRLQAALLHTVKDRTRRQFLKTHHGLLTQGRLAMAANKLKTQLSSNMMGNF